MRGRVACMMRAMVTGLAAARGLWLRCMLMCYAGRLVLMLSGVAAYVNVDDGVAIIVANKGSRIPILPLFFARAVYGRGV